MPQCRDCGHTSARTDDASRPLASAPHRPRRDARPPRCFQIRGADEDRRGGRRRPSYKRCQYSARAGSVGRWRQEELVGARSRLWARDWPFEGFEHHEGSP